MAAIKKLRHKYKLAKFPSNAKKKKNSNQSFKNIYILWPNNFMSGNPYSGNINIESLLLKNICHSIIYIIKKLEEKN